MADSTPARGVTAAADIMEILLRNMQALATAQQQVMDGFGLLAKQQSQLAQALLRNATPGTLKLSPNDPAANIDWLKAEMENTQATVNELSQLIMNISGTAATTLQTRSFAALDELKAVLVALQPAPTQSPSVAAPPAKLAAPAAKAAPIPASVPA